MREEVKELWKLCFPEDSSEFVELYFSSKYTDDITSVIKLDEKVVSALQRIPYSMTYKGHTIPVSYVSGACTHPSMRSTGLMTRLLTDAHKKMYNDGILLSTLIPANEGLIAFYRKSQYTIVFKQKDKFFSLNGNNFTKNISFAKPMLLEKDIYNIYNFIYTQQSKESSCILHTLEDMNVIIADHKLSGGDIWIGQNKENDIVSIAFIINEEDKIQIKEIVSLNDKAEKTTINFLLEHYNNNSAYITYPSGMARVINALELLKLYAINKDTDYLIEVYGDDTISENNGFFLISDGTCIKLKNKPYQEFSDCKYLKLNISELTEFLFKDEEAYMNLMLN